MCYECQQWNILFRSGQGAIKRPGCSRCGGDPVNPRKPTWPGATPWFQNYPSTPSSFR